MFLLGISLVPVLENWGYQLLFFLVWIRSRPEVVGEIHVTFSDFQKPHKIFKTHIRFSKTHIIFLEFILFQKIHLFLLFFKSIYQPCLSYLGPFPESHSLVSSQTPPLRPYETETYICMWFGVSGTRYSQSIFSVYPWARSAPPLLKS